MGSASQMVPLLGGRDQGPETLSHQQHTVRPRQLSGICHSGPVQQGLLFSPPLLSRGCWGSRLSRSTCLVSEISWSLEASHVLVGNRTHTLPQSDHS